MVNTHMEIVSATSLAMLSYTEAMQCVPSHICCSSSLTPRLGFGPSSSPPGFHLCHGLRTLAVNSSHSQESRGLQ